MLANSADHHVQSGALNKEVHLRAASLHELIDFIADELPRWRDHPDRSKQTSETALTSQLCSHLTTASRFSPGWDILQFRVEEPDEFQKGRKIDLVASPCGPTIWIEGRRCTQFDTLLPIECKRLPTPKDKDRDEWEYVINRKATTGGIQRFKAGNYGAVHGLAAMIAYIQEDSPVVWYSRLNTWIKELDGSVYMGWTVKDMLHSGPLDARPNLATFRSSHSRERGLPDIDIRHLWIQMN
ncbi:MAG: hypothetical protein K9J74_04270 [Sulfuritalea sp.]|nr:hypothetical protein [Sulfuritalea sp.]